ncbi:MAG: GNAT family N-acetyltransferase [Chloroflexi bacterium]|nr:GNAT family N-acetyltransferase [Chloroflexota bacterium]
MNEVLIRRVQPKDLGGCYLVETACWPPEEAAARETIQLRINAFPDGFFVAELDGRIVGMVNGACTDREDLSDEELKQLIGHDVNGRNMVIFALAVLPEFQGRGVARRLMLRFIWEAGQKGKQKILLICKDYLIPYYEKQGFVHAGLSRSTHGGAEWHQMSLSLAS